VKKKEVILMAPTVFVFWILQELLNLGSEHRGE
jgi:hypothetical protein